MRRMDGWKTSFHLDVHGWMTGWMTRRIKGKLHDVLAIFSYCPKVPSPQIKGKLHSSFTICNNIALVEPCSVCAYSLLERQGREERR